MGVGHCIAVDYQIGCWVDAISYMDSACSGQRQCDVRTIDIQPHLQYPCRRDLNVYLEASYTCVKG